MIGVKGLVKRAFELKESRGNVIADTDSGITVAFDSLRRNRELLEGFVKANPNFFYSLVPVEVPRDPLVVRLMAEAGRKAGTGPMAAVAGVLADLAVKDMINAGCKVAVVEDGGEVSAMSDVPVDVALAAGDDPLSKRFGFRLTDFPVGVATSSGRFSHALSFGDAEAVTVFCDNAGLADAVATAAGNVVKGDDRRMAIQRGMDKALSVEGVEGVVIMYGGLVGTAGRIPRMIKVDSSPC